MLVYQIVLDPYKSPWYPYKSLQNLINLHDIPIKPYKFATFAWYPYTSPFLLVHPRPNEAHPTPRSVFRPASAQHRPPRPWHCAWWGPCSSCGWPKSPVVVMHGDGWFATSMTRIYINEFVWIYMALYIYVCVCVWFDMIMHIYICVCVCIWIYMDLCKFM